jgi:hypothetical protein
MGGSVATRAPTRSSKTWYLSVCYTTVDCQTDSYTLLRFLGKFGETYKVSVVIDTFINPFAEKEAGNNFVFFWIITK